MALLWLPMLQQITGFFKELELKGAFVAPKEPRLEIDSIINLSFQKQTEDYLNFNFGFRPFSVKLKNTIDYLLYKKINTYDQLEGKDGFIFSIGSMGRTFGIFYNGFEKNKETISKINDFREDLRLKGVTLISLFAPSKELIYMEKIPFEYYSKILKHSDYNDYMKLYKEYNIPNIDFASHFRQIKNKSDYAIFTKTGFHWSSYASYLVQDSIIKYINNIEEDKLIQPELLKMERVKSPQNSEADFEDPMNLLISLNQEYYTYPVFKSPKKVLKNKKPKIIVIGDSFFWQIKDLKQLNYVFSDDSQFWYYFEKTSFPINGNAPILMSDINIINELHSADYVILLCSFGSTDRFPYGITEYYNKNTPKRMISIILEALDNHYLNPNKQTNTSTKLTEAKNILQNQKTILLKAYNNKYVCSDGTSDNTMIADKEKASSWETFHLLEFGKNRVAIFDYNNNILSAELGGNGKLICNRGHIKEWESFEIIYIDKNHIALKAYNNKFITVNKMDKKLYANSNSIEEASKFEILFLKE